MLEKIRNFFAAPVFPDDPEKTRITRVLNILLLSFLFVLAIGTIAIAFVMVKKLENLLIYLGFFLAMLASRWLMQRGRIRFACILLASTYWIFVTIFVFLSGGMTGVGGVFYLAGTVVVGLILGERAAIIVGVISVLTGFGMVLTEELGNPLPRVFPVPARAGWFDLVVATYLVTVSLTITLRSLKSALQQAGQRLEERKQAEAELRQRAQELTTIHTLGHCVNAELSLDQVIAAAIHEVYAAVEADLVLFFLREGQNLHLKGSLAKDEKYNHKKTPIYHVGESLCGLAVENKQHLVSIDIRNDPRCVWQECKETELRSFIALPLRSGEQIIGVLGIASATERDFDQQATFLETLASEISIGLRNTLLYEQAQQEIAERKQAENEIQRQVQRLAALRAVDTAITSSFDLNVTLDVILKQAIAQLNVDAAAVLLLSQHTDELEYIVQRGFYHADALQATPVRLGESYAGRAVMQRALVSIPDLRQNPPILSSVYDAERFVSYCGIPLLAKGQIKGVLEVFQRSPFSPDPDWLRFLESLAGQTAIAIDNTELFDGLERSNLDLTLAYNTTLESWAKALEIRDVEARGHSQRVTNLTMNLARRFGIPDQDLSHVYRGALLHDIGKMGISDEILLKAGPLNDDEWKVVRQHPIYAQEMLSVISYLRPALDIPYCHHEKWDGSGYPRGLASEQIPLPARIFAVVDVWDTLCSPRPYRPAWPEEKALDYIHKHQGIEFDPRVVEMFMRIVEYRP